MFWVEVGGLKQFPPTEGSRRHLRISPVIGVPIGFAYYSFVHRKLAT